MSESLHEEPADSEPAWWQMASPVWLFRAKPAEYVHHGSICPGLLFLPGLFALLMVHVVFLGIPVGVLIFGDWHPQILWLTAPVVLLWAVLVPADIKFRLQGATRDQRLLFDKSVINWFGFVSLPVNVLTGLVGLVWWVVWLFV